MVRRRIIWRRPASPAQAGTGAERRPFERTGGMLKGFMDHWVPTRDNISGFWKLDFQAAAKTIDELKRDIDFNNFTFYTKWYTNGIRSELPYLCNHPEASNVKTNNEWGRKIVSHLHEKNVSVGAMIQFLTYDRQVWEREMTIDEWDVGEFAATDLPVRIADFTNPLFQTRVKEIIKEHLTQFPGIDYLFLEFEGVRSAALQAIYEKWAQDKGLPRPENVHYDPERAAHCECIGQQPELIWSDEVHAMMRHYYGLNLRAVQEAADELGYEGIVGVVYHAYGYEAFIYPDIVPDTRWWLVPWNYWVFEDESERTERRKQVSKELMEKWKREGHRVCYIGDVTMGRNGFDPDVKTKDIRDFYDFSVRLGLDGYLGMGNPVPEVGLKWQAVTDEHVLEARKLYRELYGKGEGVV